MEEANQYPQEQSHQGQLRQHREDDQQPSVNVPWWRSGLFGYLICPLLICIASVADLSLQRLGFKIYTLTAPFYLANVIIAWLWGVGPALLGIALGFFTLDAFVVPPLGVLTFNGWSDTAIFLPFVFTQLIVVLITAQREKARRRACEAEQRMQRHAQELAETNQILSQSNRHLEELRDHLEEVNQLKDYFLSQASHELKTPITAIRGQTQLVLRRLSRSPQALPEQLSLPAHLQKIESQTQRLHELIEDLLDLSSLNSGKIPLRLTHCDLGSLCSEVAEDQRMLSGRDIELELPSEPIMQQADPQRLTQVIINLVTNAIKYSPENTAVRICVIREPFHTTLTIHNDGLGIPQEQLAHFFKPFYRAPEAEQSSIQGWGLGLSISKEIVERHGGRIWVESSEGKGTTFFVQLPLQVPCP